MISIQVYMNSMMNADRIVFEITETPRSQVDEVQYLHGKLQKRASCLNEELAQRVVNAMHRVEGPIRNAEALLHQLAANRYDGRGCLWARAKFVLGEDLLKEGTSKTENAMATLREVANEAFSE